MIVRNHTPFAALYFEGRDVERHDFGVMVLRGTFDVVPGGALRPSPAQEPMVESDVFHGEPNASSVYMESDLAPFKPRADVFVNAVAHAPGGRPQPSWLVRARIGALDKALRVTGPRRWVREGGRFRLTAPEPVTEVSIRYENAFGGAWEADGQAKRSFAENPVGVGYVGEHAPSRPDEVSAPQIEAPDAPIEELGKTYPPEGLGPIARSWQPRLGLAGTFDQAWQEQRWPELPLDFDFAHHNGAHPGLTYPGFLRGDEEVLLEGLTPEGTLEARLPGYRIVLLVRFQDGAMVVLPAALDTVMIDVPEARAHLTWRAAMPKGKPIRVIEPRMALPNGAAHG